MKLNKRRLTVPRRAAFYAVAIAASTLMGCGSQGDTVKDNQSNQNKSPGANGVGSAFRDGGGGQAGGNVQSGVVARGGGGGDRGGASAPEINPGPAAAALTLLAGSTLILLDRRRNPRRPAPCG